VGTDHASAGLVTIANALALGENPSQATVAMIEAIGMLKGTVPIRPQTILGQGRR